MLGISLQYIYLTSFKTSTQSYKYVQSTTHDQNNLLPKLEKSQSNKISIQYNKMLKILSFYCICYLLTDLVFFVHFG